MKTPLNLIVALALGFVGPASSPCLLRAASLSLDPNFRAPLFAEPLPALRTLLLPDGKFLGFLAPTRWRTSALVQLPDTCRMGHWIRRSLLTTITMSSLQPPLLPVAN